MSAGDPDELARLRAENKRLITLLHAHGIPPTLNAQTQASSAQRSVNSVESGSLSSQQKVALFRHFFKGRSDVYALRWENKSGKSGYAPACGNEWVPGVCEKPRIKCADCPNRKFVPLTDQVIYDHLSGHHTIGLYPLLPNDTCSFLAVDFDDADWTADIRAFAQSCRELNVPVALEISRSGQGAHAWIFFTTPVPAREARQLGAAIISHTCHRTRQLELRSYDRLFPNQDTMPKGGFGNLIALPLQKQPREKGWSVFVDDSLQPHSDPWTFLASLPAMTPELLASANRQANDGRHPLDVMPVEDDEANEPWRARTPHPKLLPGPLPESVTLTLANMIYIEKAVLTQPLQNRLIRLAAFQNPEFYRAQAMRFPVWDKPRVIGCAENHAKHIALPRGCLDAVKTLLHDNAIAVTVRDERYAGEALSVTFQGTLRPDQELAVNAMLRHDMGVLCAPTAFGKTVAAAALIAQRNVNTLVLVHRMELLKQWLERLQTFLTIGRDGIGTIGGGKSKPTGRIDIAVMQSISRLGDVSNLVERYGHVIVDECHHLSAVSFESILKRARARFVLGLTATPIRRDGQQPIIYMQCGPGRHTARPPAESAIRLETVPCFLNTRFELPTDAAIQDVFRAIATDAQRSERIAADIRRLYGEGRKILVLTERANHLLQLQESLGREWPHLFVLHGRLTAKKRDEQMRLLKEVPADAPRVILATGKLIGEGFDHPPLDTLVLAMPISWKGTLQQYAGRLHRQCDGKSDVKIYDYIDIENVAVRRMWDKRQRGYRAMGYRVGTLL